MKRNNKRAIGCLTTTILFTFLVYIGAWFIAPGSYPRAETYEFEIPEDSLIQIINKVKKENPDLTLTKMVNIPNGEQYELEGGRRDSTSHWYTIYFYYPDKNQIIHTWTRPKDKNTTTLAFVGTNNGLTLGNWKTANESFWWWKNKSAIQEFENRILKKIKKKLSPTKLISNRTLREATSHSQPH